MPPPDLLSWIDSPAPDRGIHFAGPGDTWDFVSYRDLADRARCVARQLASQGIEAQDLVAVVRRSGPGFVASLLGTMLAGAVPAPLLPVPAFGDRGSAMGHLAGLLQSLRPALVVTDDDLAERIAPLVPGTSVVTTSGEAAAPGPDVDRRPDPVALVQLTSGSTGQREGIVVSLAALGAAVDAIRAWLQMSPDDVTVSWLPPHHDMGLVGTLLVPVVNQSDLWLLRPEQFVRAPSRYIRCLATTRAALTAMPAFGLDHVVRRVRPSALAGCDLSSCRAVIVGAERIDPEGLDRFHRLLAPLGLSRQALLPAYGLAEATLAVTGLPLATGWSARSPRDAATGSRPIVGCGRPLAGVSLRILDEGGTELPPERIGEIVVRAPSVAAGYLAGGEGGGATRFDDGTLHTGDAGFVSGGQLYVVGRLGDGVKLRGRTRFAEDLEAVFGEIGIDRRRAVVLLGHRDATPTAVAIVEGLGAAPVDRLVQALRSETEGAAIAIVDVPRGTIPWTSSGKPRRAALWRALVRDELPGAVMLAVQPATEALAHGRSERDDLVSDGDQGETPT